MSAFLVTDKTIHKILTLVDGEIRQSRWLKGKFEKELHVDFANPDWQTQLGQKMWDLNQLALGYRYGDEKQDLLYTFHPVLCTPMQAYKSLHCWNYQCSEGEIPEESKLYTFFDTVVLKHLADSIIMRTTEYEQAEWG